MDLNVYTSALETKILQMLSQVYHVAKYRARINCEMTVNPSHRTWCKFSVYNLIPRDVPASKVWGLDLYERLRTFPCDGAKQVAFTSSKSHWTEERYGSGYTWDYVTSNGGRIENTWANLVVNKGFSVTIEGWIETPTEASKTITVKLNWEFQAIGGEPEPPEPEVVEAIPILLPLHEVTVS